MHPEVVRLLPLRVRLSTTTRLISDAHPAKSDTTVIKRNTTYDSLNQRHRIIAEGGIPPAIYENQKFKWEIAERFGQFGMASGIDIRQLWPSVEEIEEKKALKLYRKLEESVKIAEDAQAAEKEKILRRKEEIAKNLENYDKELEAFEKSQQKLQAISSEHDEVLQRRIREIQEYFGYWIDPKDPRFTVMLKQKELEEKKAARKAKKEAQRAKLAIV